MPYIVAKGHGCPASKPWAVLSNPGTNSEHRLGCHETKEEAILHLAAVSENAPADKYDIDLTDEEITQFSNSARLERRAE